MSEKTGIVRSWIEAPKWENASDYLQKLAYSLNLDIEIRCEKHFIRETVYFKVEGEESKLIRFKSIFDKTMKEYNKE